MIPQYHIAKLPSDHVLLQKRPGGDIVTTYETLNVNGLMQMRSGDTARVKAWVGYFINDFW